MPVVTESGLVGFVSEVGPYWCRVTTLLSTDVSVGTVTARAGESGLIQGDYQAVYDGNCTLRYLREEADVGEGDRLITSGSGSVYPYGIPVGRVVETGMNAYSRTVEAKIEPFCDMTDMENVVILTSYDRFADGNKMPDTEVITDGEVSS